MFKLSKKGKISMVGTIFVGSIMGLVTLMNRGVQDKNNDVEADFEEEDLKPARRSEIEFSNFVKEDEHSLLEVEDAKVTEKVEVQEENKEEDNENVEEVESEEESVLAETQETETPVNTSTQTNTGEASSNTNISNNQGAHETRTNNANQSAQGSEETHRRNEEQLRAEAEAQREAAELARREAEEKAAREAEEARQREIAAQKKPLSPNQLLRHGSNVGSYQGNRVWLYDGPMDGISFTRDTGEEVSATTVQIRVDNNFIGLEDGRDYSRDAAGNYGPVVIQSTSNGKVLHMLYAAY